MQIVIRPEEYENNLELIRAFENVVWPEFDDRLITLTVDAPKVTRFVNLFLNSNLNARVFITPPAENIDRVNYAGLFSGCTKLTAAPVIDNSKNVSLAAAFKNCSSFRASLHGLNTENTVDFRQCFWGASNFSGNGIQSWDFSSARSPDAFRNFFGKGSAVRQVYYDDFIRNLHKQMKAGTLPTPMSPVDMGTSEYSPLVKQLREELIAYGWDIRDGGMMYPEVEKGELEKIFFNSVHDRLESNPDNFLEGVDLSPVTRSSQGGILISPKHMIFTYHWKPSVGKVVTFWNGQTAKVAKLDVHASVSGMGTDVVLVTLDREVEGCNPVYFLPKDWKKACPLMALQGSATPFPPGMNTPTVWFDRSDRICVAVINKVDTRYEESPTGPRYYNQVVTQEPDLEIFKNKYKGAVPGDSGSPQCFVCHDKLVISHLITTGGPGGGNFLSFTPLREWLNSKLAEEGYAIQEISI